MSAPEQKGSFWATIPGFLTGLAALIAALTGLYQVVGPKLLMQQHQTHPNYVDPTSPMIRGDLQKKTWLLLIGRATQDVQSMARLCRVPFLFNGRIVVDPNDLRQDLQKWSTGYPSTLDKGTLLMDIRNESAIMTVAQLKAKIGQKVIDILAGSDVADEDLCLELKGDIYFYRYSQNGTKCIGWLK